MGCVSLALVGCIGFGVASAGYGPASDGLFSSAASDENTSDQNIIVSGSSDTDSSSILTSTSERDISQNVQSIEDELEAERIAAEEQALAEEQAQIAAAEEAKAAQQAQAATEAAASALASLSDVDWSVGEEAFVAEWTARINAFLAGSPLAGYGSVFAQAAWDNGVDPRWSPAIANTESSKGSYCFLPYNAWGWGESSWSNWEEAIYAHVAGLSENYGYSLTYSAAKRYCPPNYDSWFNSTLSAMKSI